MKVAIDTGPLKSGDKVRGVGYYTRELLNHLKQFNSKEFSVDGVDPKLTDLSTYDILHLPYFNPFFVNLPLRKTIKTVVSIHDTIPLIYPDHYPPGIKGRIKLEMNKLLLKKVDHVITDTESSKKDIVRFLEVPQEKVTATYLAARDQFTKISNKKVLDAVRRKYQLPEKFVLYIGDVNYNKNLLTLTEACKVAGTPLVVVGKQAVVDNFDRNHIENQPLVEFLDACENNPMIIRTGFVPDEDVVALCNLASVYVQPSLYEGFGLPVLEAMACGTPVIISKTQALVEIAGDTALIADPHSSDDFAEKIKMILRNSGQTLQLVRKGLKKVKEYSWEKTALETLMIYKKVI